MFFDCLFISLPSTNSFPAVDISQGQVHRTAGGGARGLGWCGGVSHYHGTQSTYHAKCRRECSSGPGRPSIPGKLIVINQVTETEQGLADDYLFPLLLLLPPLPPPLVFFLHLILFFLKQFSSWLKYKMLVSNLKMTLWDLITQPKVWGVSDLLIQPHKHLFTCWYLFFFGFVILGGLELVSYPLWPFVVHLMKTNLKRNTVGKPLLKIFSCTIISHLKTVAYLAVQLHHSKHWPNYSITPILMVSMTARCIFPWDAPWRNECLINHHPGNNTPSSLCRMCQTLTRTLGEIFLPVQPQPLIWI